MNIKPKKIPIKLAKEIAKDLNYDEVIIVGANYETGTQSVCTFGKSLAACENAAIGGNAIKKLLKWPEDKCNAKPKRIKKAKMDYVIVIPDIELFYYCGYFKNEQMVATTNYHDALKISYKEEAEKLCDWLRNETIMDCQVQEHCYI